MTSIFVLGIIISLIALLALGWNIYHTKDHTLSGSSVSLLFAFLVGISLMFEPDAINLPWISYKKIKEQADRSELAAKAVAESLAIQQWNFGRLPEDNQVQKQKQEAIGIFKEIYGNKYSQNMRSLHQKGLILTLPEEIDSKTQQKDKEVPTYLEMLNRK